MVVLVLAAFAIGAGTAVSPCVLPVLPAVLSASGTGGRRRPLGVVLGLTATFTVTIVGLASAVDGVGLGSDALRWVAIVVLAGFGVVLFLPPVADRIEAKLSPIARLGPHSRGDGFRSGLLVGAAFGFVYTPCAGPVLAAVIATSAASGKTIAVGLAYAAGTGIVLLALALGGRALLDRVRRAGRGPGLQRALGAILVATAGAMALNLDIDVQQSIARHIPDATLTSGLEKSSGVGRQLTKLHGGSAKFASTADGSAANLRDGGPAPALAGYQRWFNTPGDRPLSLAALRRQHRVTLVDFWTYTCINCVRSLPYLKAFDDRYRKAGLTIIGVHSPEFSFEKDAGNVAKAIRTAGVRYPVVQDNDLTIWNAFGNQFWPGDYLIDADGHVRFTTSGEGGHAKLAAAIRTLLARRNDSDPGSALPAGATGPSAGETPETYLGARGQGFDGGPLFPGTNHYPSTGKPLALNAFRYGGTWSIASESATAGTKARLDATVRSKEVYLVASPPRGHAGTIRVLLDGRPVSAGHAAGADAIDDGLVRVDQQRMYRLVQTPRSGVHHLTLRASRGTRAFSMTFG